MCNGACKDYLIIETIINNPRYTTTNLLRPTFLILWYIFIKSKLDLKLPLLFALCNKTAGKKMYIKTVTKIIIIKISFKNGSVFKSIEIKKLK